MERSLLSSEGQGMAKSAAMENGTRTFWIKTLSGIFVGLVIGALAFFFNHTQLDAHPQMKDKADKFETDLNTIKKDVRDNRESLIRLETRFGTNPEGS